MLCIKAFPLSIFRKLVLHLLSYSEQLQSIQTLLLGNSHRLFNTLRIYLHIVQTGWQI